jgi:hypothetical protein
LETINIAQLYFSDQVRVSGAVYQNAVTHWYAEHYLGIKLYIKVSERYFMGRQDKHMEYTATVYKLFTDIKELGKDAQPKNYVTFVLLLQLYLKCVKANFYVLLVIT